VYCLVPEEVSAAGEDRLVSLGVADEAVVKLQLVAQHLLLVHRKLIITLQPNNRFSGRLMLLSFAFPVGYFITCYVIVGGVFQERGDRE
jgi:hypothetical protein